MTDREKHISVLQDIDRAYRTFTQEEYRALEYAISSLKTDEAYQIMYEGGEIFTKSDVVATLTELKTEIDIMSDTVVEGRTVSVTSWRGMQKRICKLIQSKIDKLKENKDAI